MHLPRRSRGERGAALVEFVLIVPLLALIVGAVFEFGLAWRDSMTVSNALRSGARVGSNAGRERLADYNLLKSIEAAMAEIPTARIEKIIVYRATTANSAPPSACTALTTGGVNTATVKCNVYSGSDLARPVTDFAGTTSCGAAAPDRFWCPTTRANQQALSADYLGVWMQVRYTYVTRMFPGSGIILKDRCIMRLEPRLT
jgi:Flp pilus assembly protein TadG